MGSNCVFSTVHSSINIGDSSFFLYSHYNIVSSPDLSNSRSWTSLIISVVNLLLSRMPAKRRRQKSELWGLRTGQARSSIYLISVLDFTGACVPVSPPSAHRFSASHSSRGGHFVVCRLLSKWSSHSDKTSHFCSLNLIVLGLLQGLKSG